MRLGVLVIAGGLILGTAGLGMAGEVNCKQVNKYLGTGRTVKDVAETMVISESDVKKCQEEAGKEGTAGGAAGGAAKEGEKGGATKDMPK